MDYTNVRIDEVRSPYLRFASCIDGSQCAVYETVGSIISFVRADQKLCMVVPESVAQHLGYSFLRVAQSQGLALPRQEIHKFCPNCGAPSTVRDFARVVKLQPRKARRKRQAHAALLQTRERRVARIQQLTCHNSRDTVTNKAGLLRKCTACGTVRVRPYYTVKMVLEAAKREGLVVLGVQTPRSPPQCPALRPPGNDVAFVAASASTTSERMRTSMDAPPVRLESQTMDAWCTLAGVTGGVNELPESEPVVVMNPLLLGFQGGESKSTTAAVGGSGNPLGARSGPRGQQPSLYSSIAESDAPSTMQMGEDLELPDLPQMACMKHDRDFGQSYGMPNVANAGDVELAAVCNDEVLPECGANLQGIVQPPEGHVFVQREGLQSTRMAGGFPAVHEELGSLTVAQSADGIPVEAGSEEPPEGNVSESTVPNASPCHDTGGRGHSDCQWPVEGVSLPVMCPPVGEVHAIGLVGIAGHGILESQPKAALTRNNSLDTSGLGEQAGTNDGEEARALPMPSGGDVQGSNTVEDQETYIVRSQGGTHGKGKHNMIRDVPSLAQGSSQGINSAGAAGQGQSFDGEGRSRRRSLKSRTWFKLGRTWKYI